MRVFLGIFGIFMGSALCTVHAAQEVLGKPISSQQLLQQSGSQRIVNSEIAERFTPEMLSERRIRKYRRPMIFAPIQKENLTKIKKRKTFLLDSN